MTAVLLVEDHALMAKAMTRLLQEQCCLDVVAVVDSAEAAQKKLPELKVDLVLVDVSLPRMNGIELVERIHKDCPDLPCVVLSGHRTSDYVNRSLAVGARGYVLKEDIDGILEGIPAVLQGRIYVSKALRDD